MSGRFSATRRPDNRQHLVERAGFDDTAFDSLAMRIVVNADAQGITYELRLALGKIVRQPLVLAVR